MIPYEPEKIETKWQDKWEEQKIYQAIDGSKKQKFYALIEFPYPSGAGFHVGNARSWLAMDAYSRKKRMNGFNVLYPMGWDAFGLPAENYALKNKLHPSITTAQNIATFKRQIKSLGLSFDWSREINTTDPKYYKWTQWIFLKLLEKGLAYRAETSVNWCPICKTTLADEEVLADGSHERCGKPTEKRFQKQWLLKITDYAQRLLDDLNLVDYSQKIRVQQENWIGRSEGAELKFGIKGTESQINVFTTRIDTIFGASALVVAPEHKIINQLEDRIKNIDEVRGYQKKAKDKSELERTDLAKEKTGVRLEGIIAVNPFSEEEIPVFAADYIMESYGTGAIMMVPAHDNRDYGFAQKYNLPIKEVIAPYWLDSKYPPRPDKQTEKREVVTIIVRNPKDKKLLCLKWKKADWQSFPTGGVENDDPKTAARRETLEETGYKNLKFIAQIPGSTYVEFYRPHKDSNVYAHFQYLVFELENEEKIDIEKNEINNHEPVWISENEIESFINVENQLFMWRRFKTPDLIYTGYGVLIDSGKYSGLFSEDACNKMVSWLQEKNLGNATINYKMRDWIFSRQHYWGEPIPVIHCQKCGAVPVPETDLPVELPYVENYEPSGTGESPLANITDWVNTKCPQCQGEARRETDTMPNWAGSNWYFLRYLDPDNSREIAAKDKMKYWMPVDIYQGGFEHTTLHLLYSRFIYKFLYDIGVVPGPEPYAKRRSHGIVLGPDNRKMSKSFGNVVNPDDIVKKHGADTLRLYEMFIGPFDQAVSWNEDSLQGCFRFLNRVWKLFQEKVKEEETSKDILRKLHQTARKVGEDIENLKFNTMVASLMKFINEWEKSFLSKEDAELFVKIIAPLAPHLAEEAWVEILKNKFSVHQQPWPKFDEKLIIEDKVIMVIQINGKVRGQFEMDNQDSQDQAKVTDQARKHPQIIKYLEGKEASKNIFVPGKLINFVI
ncbi:class I tRNA ligase family protein [Candidatus Parcubacteria bacterium]|nr:class I tRNA ligase family protein [Patescibacteria group bacterium]MBU4466708.1 class I tRNA ligase family protein [Patescibacteria group bacterium]MCG2688023.1 class I tRNA ligase family protein [Candidatus Parcubacteria bacterium]